VLSAAAGALDVGGNVLLVKIWKGHRWAAPAMNILHLMWGIGSFLAPLVVAAIGLKPEEMARTWGVIGVTCALVGIGPLFCRPPLEQSARALASTASPNIGGETVDLLLEADGDHSDSDGGDGTDTINGDQNDGYAAGLTAVRQMSTAAFATAFTAMCIFYFTYAGAEHSPGDWLATYTITALGRSNEDGAMATSVYWGALMAGRLASVATSMLLSTAMLVTGHFALSLSGALLFITVSMWGTAAFAISCVSMVGDIFLGNFVAIPASRLNACCS
jgi:fucose permease